MMQMCANEILYFLLLFFLSLFYFIDIIFVEAYVQLPSVNILRILGFCCYLLNTDARN